MKYTTQELLIIWADRVIGAEHKGKESIINMLDGCGEIKAFLEKNKDAICLKVGAEKYNELYAAANKEYLSETLYEYEQKGITAITVKSKDYPKSLKDIPTLPFVIYAKGDISLLHSKSFSIVGSRKSLPISKNLAANYAKSLSDAGFTLVTGTAEGVDQTVLETALSENKNVVSVLASGFDNVYPASQRNLIDKVAKSGLVISEYPPSTKAMPFFFPVRNRIIAALSEGVLIVSAGKKSGTMYTAEYAEEYGKNLFAIPYSVGIESGAGCNELIKRGAILTDSVNDILEFYGVEKKKKIFLTPEEKIITDLLKDGEKHIDIICDKLGKQIYEITPTLAVLEIKGIVVKNGNNVYGLISTDSEAI